mmetsp:Transcript_16231/g.30703  ORF Transcript_16231/g.30703 Transcript_16231/m.30703 type:complete len:88 (-) Transcript_16231:4174-4437(-)
MLSSDFSSSLATKPVKTILIKINAMREMQIKIIIGFRESCGTSVGLHHEDCQRVWTLIIFFHPLLWWMHACIERFLLGANEVDFHVF